MNKLITFAAALLLCSASYVNAADPHDHGTAPTPKAAATKMDKPAAENAPACAKMGMGGMGMGMMGGGMGAGMPTDFKQKMMEQMAAIRQTNDPAERQKLMQEHFQSMQEAMQAMRGTGAGTGNCGCCCKQHGAHEMGSKPACKKGDKCARGANKGKMQQGGMMGGAMSGMMEQRMDMMQTMMENMLEHQRQMQQGK